MTNKIGKQDRFIALAEERVQSRHTWLPLAAGSLDKINRPFMCECPRDAWTLIKR